MKYLVKTEMDIPPVGASVDYLGSWCFKNPCLGISKNYSVMPYIWQNKYKLNQDGVKLNHIRKRLFGKFACIMNEIHKLNLPTRYWTILTQSWFDDYLNTFYDRYQNILLYKEKVGDFEYKTLEPARFQTPVDMYRMKRLCENNPIFNEQLFSQILDIDYNKRIKFTYDIRHKCVDPKVRYSDKIILTNLYCSTETTIGIKDILNGYCEISNYPQLEEGFESYTLSSRRLIFDTIGDECIDDFEKLFFKSLTVNTPKLIIEVYQDIRKYILGNINLPKMMVTNVDHEALFLAQLIMAETILGENKIIWGQHGPNYDMFYLYPTHNHEIENPDKFYCWGWAKDNDKYKKNVPSLSISEKRKYKKPNKNNGPLLFISNAGGRYVRILSSATTSTDFIKYSQNQCRFVKSLEKSISDAMSYRPYFNDYEQGIEKNIRQVKPNINYIKGGNIDQLYNEFRLVVYDTPYTTLGNLLALNKPNLLFFEKDHFIYNPKYSHVFEMLYIAGILHYCPIKAAEFVNTVFDNPTKWWNSDDVQNARSEYIKYFAYSHKDYTKIWADSLLNDYNDN
jgi:putative transferase (TIGR04331 family)